MAEGGLPFTAEYAKTGRSACRKCKSLIGHRDLRIGSFVQSRHHDGMDTLWFHFECLLEKQKGVDVAMIANFDNLRWEDQEQIKTKIGAASDGVSTNGNGILTKAELKEYGIEYAKTNRSGCIACELKIEKGEIRISKLDHGSETALKMGGVPLPRFHHVKCFMEVKVELGFTGTIGQIPGFKRLTKADQKSLQSKFKAVEAPAAGKRKLSEAAGIGIPAKVAKQEAVAGASSSTAPKNGVESKEKEKMVKQNQSMHQLRDFLSSKYDDKLLKKADLEELLSFNGQASEGGPETLMERLSDVMVFGSLKKCQECKKGQLVFKSGQGYECSGYLSEFTRCAQVVEVPERKPFSIPKTLKPVLAGYAFKKVSDRIIVRRVAEIPAGAGAAPLGFVKINVSQLSGFKIFVSSAVPDEVKGRVMEMIADHKGKVSKTFKKDVSVVVTTQEEMDLDTSLKRAVKNKALELDIPVVSADFITGLTIKTDLASHLEQTLLSGWTVKADIPALVEKLSGRIIESNGKARKLEKKEESVRVRMKDGNVVDPDCDCAEWTHVYKAGKLTYSVVLKRTDIDTNTNSFYKLQLLEDDSVKNRSYSVFRSWGRIGTVIGGNKLEDGLDLEEALDIFNKHYKEKTLGNVFGKPFTMKPGGYMLLDISYDQPTDTTLTVSEKSKLAQPVQELVLLIFDVKRMMSTLVEFDIDTKKMPLGKISRAQTLKAFEILDKLMKELDKNAEPSRMLVDYSNRFFSLIPHNFGTGSIPVLNKKTMVQSKLEMLEQLLEIELAFQMIQGAGSKESEAVDDYYQRLGTLIDPLEQKSHEYEIIDKYLTNTHGSTHSDYKLTITNVHKVKRDKEDERFEAFKAMKNHQLLWHGSRTTNYAGILSQGLRIAPPEAPVTGYMFGKGIYFADMVSKSANYCYPSRDNRKGLLLLCQVALGNMKELTRSNDKLLKAPAGYHSVLGLGMTRPEPDSFTALDGVIKVPFGRPTPRGIQTELLYNEYIIYDVSQVQLRYIVQVDFDYDGARRRV